MARVFRIIAAIFVWFLTSSAMRGQTFPSPEWFRHVVLGPKIAERIPGPVGLRDFVINGKLRLSLADAVQLTLVNNSDVRINQLNYEVTRFGILRAQQPFDPSFNSTFNQLRSTSPTSSTLQGAPILTSLSHQSQFNYSQTLLTGTNYGVGLSANRASSNSRFATLNPSIFSALNFAVSQPLLRHRGLFVNRAPILIARRNVRMSRATFEAQVSDSLARAINQYWDMVQGRENLGVLLESLKQAQASYGQNKRALELGALPPLDIYRSESQVATRRLAVIQAEYALKQTEDELRRTIGADLDPTIAPLDLELTESAEPPGEMLSVDAQSAIERALRKRPELEVWRQQLLNDDMAIRLAHNGLQPDLNLGGSYSSSGLAGNQFDLTQAPPVLVLANGLGAAFNQIGNFKFPTYGFSLQLRLPIRNRGAEADLGTSEVFKQRDLYSMRRSEQAARQDALNAVHQLEQAKLSVAAGKIARELALKNLEAEQRKYELGAQTIFFVLDAQTQLAQAEVNLVQNEINYQRSLTSVSRATGELLERYRVEIAEPPRN